MVATFQQIGATFSPDVVKACLVLALIAAAAVIGLFAYVGQRTDRPSYRYWTMGWLFYAVFVAGLIAGDVLAQDWHLAMIPPACVALSALFMLAGNLEVVEHPLGRGRLVMAALVILGVNHLAHQYGFAYWFDCPAYWALAGAAIQAGVLFYRTRQPTTGTRVVVTGYTVWALQIVAMPLVQTNPMLFGVSGFVSAGCLIAVAMGLILDHQISNSEQKYRSLLDGTPEAIFMVDLSSLNVLDANLAAVRLARRSLKELTGASFLEMCPELRKVGTNKFDQRQMFASVFKPLHEFHLVRSDGALVICEGDTTLARWLNQAVVQVRVRELDPEKNMGSVLRRAEKMSSLGQLIAGVAHELNNPLAVVVGYSQILAKQPNESEFLRTNVSHILHEAERAATIVRDLLSFARPCEPKFTTVNLNQVVESVLTIRRRDLEGQAVTVKCQLAPGLAQTKADPLQLEQVLNNLITNAVHAMVSRAGPRNLTITTVEEGLFQRLSLADTGGGIPADVLPKIFDPFFTTKPAGKGTGLGLSISHNILQEHHGRLWVESVANEGATFLFELPVLPCESPVDAPVKNDTVTMNLVENGRRHLLVVDDEPGIRDVLQAILVSCGYKVTCAGNGVEALSELKKTQFDAVITDMCMPEMDGEKLFASIQAKFPKLADRVIFVTGDTVSTRSRTFLDQSGCHWLSKPFNIRDVELAVETSVHERPVAGMKQSLN